MAGVNETVVPAGQQRHLRQMSGWRLALLLVSPYLLIQFNHEVAPGLFPNFFSVVGEDQVILFRDWANRSLLYLKNEDLLGLFNFKDFTRTVSGWLEYPLDVSEQLLIAGGGPFGLGAVPWVTLVAGFAVAGAWLGGWRLSLLVGGCSLYLAIFDVWDDSMITLSIVVVVAPVAAVIGWALGLAASKSKRFESFLGELHRWMRQVGHDGRLLKSTSNRWRFLVWHSGSVAMNGPGSRRCAPRGSALRRQLDGSAGTGPLCIASSTATAGTADTARRPRRPRRKLGR